MPNKYEREIEEILRNLERTEPKTGFGKKGSGRVRRTAGVRRSMPNVQLTFSEWCLVIACIAGLSAGGWVFAQHSVEGANVITGTIAVIGAICVVLVAISPFFARPRYSSSSGRYNTTIHRISGNPFRRLGTRWHLMMLKLRYRKGQDRER